MDWWQQALVVVGVAWLIWQSMSLLEVLIRVIKARAALYEAQALEITTRMDAQEDIAA